MSEKVKAATSRPTTLSDKVLADRMPDSVSKAEAWEKEARRLRGVVRAALPLLVSSRTFLDATMVDPTDHPHYGALVTTIRDAEDALGEVDA